jgi:hypothetical protein
VKAYFEEEDSVGPTNPGPYEVSLYSLAHMATYIAQLKVFYIELQPNYKVILLKQYSSPIHINCHRFFPK